MGELARENGTSISNELYEILWAGGDLKDRLTAFADKLHEEFGAKVSFCELFGKRWSHFAGSLDAVMPDFKEEINDRFGIMAEEFPDDNSVKQEVLKILRDGL